MVRSIGADHVIDYTQEDFTKNGQRYDLILDDCGISFDFRLQACIKSQGNLCHGRRFHGSIFQAMLLGPLISMTGSKKMGILSAKPNQEDLVFMKELLEAGKVIPVIDRRYPLSEVPEALRYLGEGHARGKVVITVEHNNK